jgi:hypothetical protein
VDDGTPPERMSFEQFRRSFYYGSHADMQHKFLASMSDGEAADAIAEILEQLGTAFDTGDLEPVRRAVYAAQVSAYRRPAAPEVDDAPFAGVADPLAGGRLALMSAGGVFVSEDDPLGPDEPTQQEALGMIKEFLRGTPTLSVIPKDTRDEELTARHPGYDARTAQRDPGTVFPLAVLRELEGEGRVRLAESHYTFVGATSQVRLREHVAPQWAERLRADEVDACLLVAT